MFPKQFRLLFNNIFKVEVFTTAASFSKTMNTVRLRLAEQGNRTASPAEQPAGGARGQPISKPEAQRGLPFGEPRGGRACAEGQPGGASWQG